MAARNLARASAVAVLVCGALAGLAGTAVGARVLYNNIPKKTPALPALGFECCQVKQFGGAVKFVEQPRKKNQDVFTINVGMDEYNCEHGSWYTNGKPECITSNPPATFSLPVTLRVNNLGPGNAVGELLAEETKTFNMPYRPSQNNEKCQGAHGTEGPENFGAWYNKKTHECYIDNFFTISYTLPIANLQEKAIISVAFNTTTYGEPPAGTQPCDSENNGFGPEDNCPYDSLNVGVNAIYKKIGPGENFEALPTSARKGSYRYPKKCSSTQKTRLTTAATRLPE